LLSAGTPWLEGLAEVGMALSLVRVVASALLAVALDFLSVEEYFVLKIGSPGLGLS